MSERSHMVKTIELIERLAGVTEELEDIVAVSRGKRRSVPEVSSKMLKKSTQKALGPRVSHRMFNVFRFILLKNLTKGRLTVVTYLAGKELAHATSVKSKQDIIKATSQLKLGKLNIKDFSADKIDLTLSRSLTTLGVRIIGSRPVCFLESGFLAGLCAKVLKKKVDLIETRCVSKGDKDCHFSLFTERDPLRRKANLPVLPAELYNQENVRLLTVLASHAISAIEDTLVFEKARRQVMMDALTQVYNHRYFQQNLRTELARSERNRTALSLIMADIDNFKKYNDAYGHPKGDEVLKKVAAIIQESVRDIDIVARYGGDEFAIILPQTDTNGALVVMNRIKSSIRKTPFYGRTKKRHVRFKITQGLAAYRKGFPHPESLIEKADRALLQAKKRGLSIVVTKKR